MTDRLTVDFESDDEDKYCCNLMVTRKDSDGITDIIASIDGAFARLIYEVLTDNIR